MIPMLWKMWILISSGSRFQFSYLTAVTLKVAWMCMRLSPWVREPPNLNQVQSSSFYWHIAIMFHILALYRFLYAKWWIQVCRGVDGGLFLPDDFKITFHDFSICFMLAKHYIRWYLWICCCGWRPVLLPWLLAGNMSLKRWKKLAVGAEKPIQSKMICFLCVMCTTCKISFLLRRFFFFFW